MKPKYEGAKKPAQLDTGSEPGLQKPCSDAGSDVSPGTDREREPKKKKKKSCSAPKGTTAHSLKRGRVQDENSMFWSV